MEPWYDVVDIHRNKEMRDSVISYRAAIAKRMARYCRHFEIANGRGRPRRITLMSEAGVRTLYKDGEMPAIEPYTAIPVRLTDAARFHMIEPTLFTTHGLQEPARVLSRDAFMAYIQEVKAEHLYEPDFLPL